MKFVFITDPIEKMKPWKDTSHALICAALSREHRVYYVAPEHLFSKHNQLYARARQLKPPSSEGAALQMMETEVLILSEVQAVFIRTDPPFDRHYFYLTLLCDFLPSTVKVINMPQTLRDWNEKLAALKFPDLTPPTLVTNNWNDIKNFQHEQKSMLTLKPIDGFGGRGIFFIEEGNRNSEAIVASMTHYGSQWIIAQKYIEEASQGDKRIILLNGEPLGAILRVHAEGKDLNNLDAGGTAVACNLSSRDLEVCAALKPHCVEKGIVFAGIDMLGDYLIEINITSPTGIQEMSRFYGRNLSIDVIKAAE